MAAALKRPQLMTVGEFLDWESPGPYLWQLVDGQPVAMSPPAPRHGAIQAETGAIIRNHLIEHGSKCGVSNHAETWRTVWAYMTIESLREILVIRSNAVGIELLRRGEDGIWPETPVALTSGVFEIASIGLEVPVAALYRGSGLV